MILRIILICITIPESIFQTIIKATKCGSPTKQGTILTTLALVLLFSAPTVHAEVSNAELLAKLESMQQQIDDLKLQLAQTQDQTDQTDAKVEAVAEVMESAPHRSLKPVKRPLEDTANFITTI